MRVLIALPLLAGCDQLFGLDHASALPPDADPSTIDADIGMLVDAGVCMGTAEQFGRSGPGGIGLFSLCITPSLGTLALAGTVNTEAEPRCLFVDQDTIGTKVCVIASEHITINANLETHGAFPVAILAFKTLTVSSTIDAAAQLTGTRGSGSNWTGCGATSNGPAGSGGSGGGAGGSFGTIGGAGGANAQGLNAGARPASSPDRVRGGCSGGTGGLLTGTLTRAEGGSGGGAVYLIAGTSIQLTATAVINASGAAGQGGSATMMAFGTGGGGGGAGGSGGLIGLDAPTILIDASATLFANGGGGGGGGGLDQGKNGSEPSATAVRTRAAGGAAVMYGAAGGPGAAINPAVAGAEDMAGAGGGGGGGAGVIKVYTPSPPPQPFNVSPPWQTN